MPVFYEFFAGGGMVRAGLGAGWSCGFANDFDPMKAAAYRANWGDAEFRLADIAALDVADMPGRPDLVWGSSPCQDLSLAGAGAGLAGARSGTYHAFWAVIGALGAQGRAPALVAIENVCGALTSHTGADFAAMCEAFVRNGYRFGPLVINADRFTPQSRARLFVVGVRQDDAIAPGLSLPGPTAPFHDPALVRVVQRLPDTTRDQAIWWRLPEPPARRAILADVMERAPNDAPWFDLARTQRLLDLMAPLHRARVQAAQDAGGFSVGTVYRRTRANGRGGRVQRAEVRFDGLAGCLRTPAGGSSRQTLLVIEDRRVRARLVSARESARLMGLPDDYVLPDRLNDALHLTGDGVAVPVVRWLAAHLFEPLLAGRVARAA